MGGGGHGQLGGCVRAGAWWCGAGAGAHLGVLVTPYWEKLGGEGACGGGSPHPRVLRPAQLSAQMDPAVSGLTSLSLGGVPFPPPPPAPCGTWMGRGWHLWVPGVAEWQLGTRWRVCPPPPHGGNREENGGLPHCCLSSAGWGRLPPPPVSLRCCHNPLSGGSAPQWDSPAFGVSPPLWQGEGCAFTPVSGTVTRGDTLK